MRLSRYDNGRQLWVVVDHHYLKRLADRGFGPQDLSLQRIRKLMDESWYVEPEERHDGVLMSDFENVMCYLINEDRGVTSVIIGERSVDTLKTAYESDLKYCWSKRWLDSTPVEQRTLFKDLVNGLDLRLTYDE